MTIYEQHGFESRNAYLKDLADNNGVDVNVVHNLAFLLGPDEDFDGLVNEVEDFAIYSHGADL